MRLEDLTRGVVVSGIVPSGAVTVTLAVARAVQAICMSRLRVWGVAQKQSANFWLKLELPTPH
jgi:hypothetical protein